MSYWLVGATWPNQNMLGSFVEAGYWQLSPDGQNVPLYLNRLYQMDVEDRIAVKTLGGRGTGLMEINAIGIITDLYPDHLIVEVLWIVTGINRQVPLYGCMRAINGPKTIPKDEELINRVFRI